MKDSLGEILDGWLFDFGTFGIGILKPIVIIITITASAKKKGIQEQNLAPVYVKYIP